MTATELIATQLQFNLDFVSSTIADFTEPEMLIRPVPAANHPLWQVGHLCKIEVEVVNSIRAGILPQLPRDLMDRFRNRNTDENSAARLASKDELIELFTMNRRKVITFVRSLSSEDLDQPAREDYRHICPKFGDLLMLLVLQGTMHAGQIQVARRMLGKPILF